MIVDVFRDLLREPEDQELKDRVRKMCPDERDGIKELMGLPKYSSQTEVLENIIRIRKVLGR